MAFEICGADAELDARFHKNNGPADETSYKAIMRTYQGFCKRVYNPGRKIYDYAALTCGTENLFELTEFNLNVIPQSVDIASTSLHSVLWRNSSPEATDISTCVLYLHTNTSNLTDALEVLPLCSEKNYSLLAFDLPGHGKSEAPLICPHTTQAGIQAAIEFITQSGINHIILWTRGMSTAAGFDFCSSRCTYVSSRSRICLLVADCPFTSVRKIVEDAANRLKRQGYFIPLTLVQLAAKVMRSSLKNRLGYDPYIIQPILAAPHVRHPCILVASSNDDYITKTHAEEFRRTLLGPCHMSVTEGGHFERRSKQFMKDIEVVVGELSSIRFQADYLSPVVEDKKGGRRSFGRTLSTSSESSEKEKRSSFSMPSFFRRRSTKGSMDIAESRDGSRLASMGVGDCDEAGDDEFNFNLGDCSLDMIDESDINCDFNFDLGSEGEGECSNKSRSASSASTGESHFIAEGKRSPQRKSGTSSQASKDSFGGGESSVLMNMIFGSGDVSSTRNSSGTAGGGGISGCYHQFDSK